MSNVKKIVIGALILVCGIIVVSNFGYNKNLGQVIYDEFRLVGDVYQGERGVLVMQEGELVGPIDSTDGEISDLTFGNTPVSVNATATATLSASTLCNTGLLTVVPTAGAATITTPTAANLISDCVPNTGNTKELWYRNGATAATSTTIAAGSNVILLEPSGGDVVITQNEWAKFVITNVDGTNVAFDVTSTQNAD